MKKLWLLILILLSVPMVFGHIFNDNVTTSIVVEIQANSSFVTIHQGSITQNYPIGISNNYSFPVTVPYSVNFSCDNINNQTTYNYSQTYNYTNTYEINYSKLNQSITNITCQPVDYSRLSCNCTNWSNNVACNNLPSFDYVRLENYINTKVSTVSCNNNDVFVRFNNVDTTLANLKADVLNIKVDVDSNSTNSTGVIDEESDLAVNIVRGLLVFLIVCVLGVIGWFTFKKVKKNREKKAKESQAPKPQVLNTDVMVNPQPQQSYYEPQTKPDEIFQKLEEVKKINKELEEHNKREMQFQQPSNKRFQ